MAELEERAAELEEKLATQRERSASAERLVMKEKEITAEAHGNVAIFRRQCVQLRHKIDRMDKELHETKMAVYSRKGHSTVSAGFKASSPAIHHSPLTTHDEVVVSCPHPPYRASCDAV